MLGFLPMTNADKHLLIFGAGYVASHLAEVAIADGWQVSVSTRSPQEHSNKHITFFKFGDDLPPHVTAVLSTVPPSDGQDPVLAAYSGQLPEAGWVGYLSSTGVYGDTKGEPVTEKSGLNGASLRAQARTAAEKGWQGLDIPVHIFRLSGIYGPGRNMLERVKEGRVQNLEQSDRPVNRVHVADIAQAVMKSIRTPQNKTSIYNLADDLPAPTKDVITYAAKLLGKPTPMAAQKGTSHLMDGSRIVMNDKAKKELGLKLTYPTFREGLNDLIDK